MKKILPLTAVFCLTFSIFNSIAAQERFDANVFAGLNMGQIDGDGAGRYNNPGIRAGVGTSLDLGGGWRPVLELAYTQKGSFIGDYNRRLSADYVELAAMISYNFFDDRVRVAAGIAPGLLVRAKVTNGGSLDEPSSNNFRRLDRLPVTLAARYRFTDHLCFETRWQNSLLGVTKEAGSGTYRIFRSNKGVFHRLVTFGLVYQF